MLDSERLFQLILQFLSLISELLLSALLVAYLLIQDPVMTVSIAMVLVVSVGAYMALTRKKANRYGQINQEYDGHYTDDGQMTWQYAYSMDELHSAMQSEQWQQAQPTDQIPDEEEQGLPYQSPLQPRRKRRSRHE